MSARGRLSVVVLLSTAAIVVSAQSNARRLTTVAALRQFPGYYHLQNVTLRGELVENGPRAMLRSDEQELRVYLKDGTGRSGAVEVRGQVIDIGRLQPDDPRVPPNDNRDAAHWPKPGEELIVNLTSIAEAPPATMPSVRALTLEPWKFDGQTVTITGNFRGRNLFGDLPDAPGKSSRYDFVLRGAEGAIWVTGLRPRGKGFDLDVDRRQDTTAWLQVTGTVMQNRGLAIVSATQLASAKAPDATEPPVEEAAAPPPPSPPAEVVFSSPTPDENDVSAAAPVRIQFSRGLLETSIPGHIRVSYVGATDADGLMFKATYDAATRAVELKFAQPLTAFRMVKVETLEGLKAFDGAPVKPWTITFSVGG